MSEPLPPPGAPAPTEDASKICLEDLGWDGHWEGVLRGIRSPGVPGRIVVEDKHAFGVVTREGEVQGFIPGRRIRGSESSDLPKVGDWVLLEPRATGGRWKILEVLPRRSQLARKHSGKEIEEQVLAANIDVVFAVQPLDQRFNLRLLERHLVMAMEGGSEPVVVLNKADLCEDSAKLREEAVGVANGLDVEIVSAKTGLGMGRLRSKLSRGKTAVFLGASGVGKSSLVNRMYGEKIQPTLEVRDSDHKGRHTTAWREMVMLPSGGLVIDTPGLREFHLWATHDGLQLAFPEIDALSTGCKFRDCSHTVERECAVRAAVDAGSLDKSRYESYVKLKREARDVQIGMRKEKRAGGPRRHRSGNSGTEKWRSEEE